MSWDEIRDLVGRGHEIGCHTASHLRLRESVAGGRLEDEIPRAKGRLEAELRQEAASFAWVGGESDTYSSSSFSAVKRAGFRYAFTTLSAPLCPGDEPLLIHRTVLDRSRP